MVSLNKCELLTSSERKHAKIRLLVVFRSIVKIIREYGGVLELTLVVLGLIKINTVSANFNNPRPSLILNN